MAVTSKGSEGNYNALSELHSSSALERVEDNGQPQPSSGRASPKPRDSSTPRAPTPVLVVGSGFARRSVRLVGLVAFGTIAAVTALTTHEGIRRSMAHWIWPASAKSTRAPQSRGRAELLHALDEQVVLLRAACDQFDKGSDVHSKEIATRLRTILHDSERGEGLLSQLGVRDESLFWNTATPVDPDNVGGSFALLQLKWGKERRYVPKLGDESLHEGWRISFEVWWKRMPVLVAASRDWAWGGAQPGLTREKMVLNVAETDGGEFVSDTLDPVYADISRRSALGLVGMQNGRVVDGLNDPVPPSLRQVAYEFLTTYDELIGLWRL